MIRSWYCVIAAIALGVIAIGCDSKGSSKGTSKSAPTSSAARKPAPAGTSAAAGPINGCASFADRTDENADHVIHWDESVAKSPARCMKIKAGQLVTWEGDFARYPIRPSGGDSPTPITQLTENISNPGVKGEERTNAEFKKTVTHPPGA
jgi:hypothetical protein